jgi:hypothetical protein
MERSILHALHALVTELAKESLKDDRSQLWSAASSLLLEIERQAPEFGPRQAA